MRKTLIVPRRPTLTAAARHAVVHQQSIAALAAAELS